MFSYFSHLKHISMHLLVGMTHSSLLNIWSREQSERQMPLCQDYMEQHTRTKRFHLDVSRMA